MVLALKPGWIFRSHAYWVNLRCTYVCYWKCRIFFYGPEHWRRKKRPCCYGASRCKQNGHCLLRSDLLLPGSVQPFYDHAVPWNEGTQIALFTGIGYLTFMGWFFCFIGFKMAVDGLLRGAGDMKMFTVANLVTWGSVWYCCHLCAKIWHCHGLVCSSCRLVCKLDYFLCRVSHRKMENTVVSAKTEL